MASQSSPASRLLRVFLSHASHDKPAVRQLYDRLKFAPVDPWLDSEKLLPGQDWRLEIARAVRNSDVVIVCLSTDSLTKEGYVQKEIKDALDIAEEKPEGTIFIIPVRLNKCIVPERLQRLQWVDLFGELDIGLEKLFRALALRAETLQSPVDPIAAIDLKRIPSLLPQAPATHIGVVDLSLKNPLKFGQERAQDLIFNEDPTLSLAAADELIGSEKVDFNHLVSRVSSSLRVPARYAVRLVFGSYPQETASLLMAKVLNATADWHGALGAADCLSKRHQPFCAELLGKTLNDDVHPDVSRLCMESLGYLGAQQWAFRLLEMIYAKNDPMGLVFSKYHYEKYYFYAIQALIRMFVLAEDKFFGDIPIYDCSDGLRFIKKKGSWKWGDSLQREVSAALAQCKPFHGDVLLKEWIPSDEPLLQQLAVMALGYLRLTRATPALKRLHQEPNILEEVRDQILLALSNIRSAEGIGVVMEAFETRPDRITALAMARCLEDVDDDQIFDRLSKKLLDFGVLEKCWVYRAWGLRRAPQYLDILSSAIEGEYAWDRGHAALAIARIDGDHHRRPLRRAYNEASGHLDKILSGLALILCGEDDSPEIVEQLRSELPTMSWQYQRQTKEDIVQVLSRSNSPKAKLLAACWQKLYSESQDY